MVYTLKNKEMPWGDYGEVLWQGIYYVNKEKEHCLSRTAPFCPGICRSQYGSEIPVVLVKESVKGLIEGHFANLNFVKIHKDKIVKLDWQKWDLSADEPEIYPSGDMDAEEYITRRKHNEALSQEMGDLYAFIPEKDGYKFHDETDNQDKLVKSTLSAKDIFIVHPFKKQEIYVSEKMKLFLESHFSDEIYFEPAVVGEPENLGEIRENYARSEMLKEKAASMSHGDWQKWYRLISEAQKLIGGIDNLKSEVSKKKRKDKIKALLNEADEMYPLINESWMLGFWR